MMTETTY